MALLCLFFEISMAQTQEDSVQVKPKLVRHYAGLSVTSTGGYGLSYRYFPEQLGFQFTGFPYKNGEDYEFNLGFSLLQRLVEAEKSKMYAYYSFSYYEYRRNNDNGFNKYEEGSNFSYGGGLGVSFFLIEELVLDLRAGLGGYSGPVFTLSGGVGFYYAF